MRFQEVFTVSKRLSKITAKYTPRDFDALYSIYKYRCLSFEQIYRFHYSKAIKKDKDIGPEYFKKKMKLFKEDNLVEETKRLDGLIPTVYSLTKDGVSAVKEHFALEPSILDVSSNKITRGYLTCSEISVAYRFMPHQYNLNCFAIETKDILDKYNIPNEYYDEKHIPKFINIRPDGLTISDKFDIFYEMDMGTETQRQLNEKWQHYRAFLKSPQNDEAKRKIIMFICNDKGNTQNRINIIKKSIADHFIDCMRYNIEIYIGTPKKLMAILKTKIVHGYFNLENPLIEDTRKMLIKNKFKVADAKQLAQDFDGRNFTYYVNSEQGNRQYVVREFFGEPISAMYDASMYDNISLRYKNKYGKAIPLIVVATNEEIAITNAEIFSTNSSLVFFTTLKRLETLPFHQAIFRINHGQMFCYDSGFNNLIVATALNK